MKLTDIVIVILLSGLLVYGIVMFFIGELLASLFTLLGTLLFSLLAFGMYMDELVREKEKEEKN